MMNRAPEGSSLGLFRAEYLRDRVYNTFEQPPYWRELSDAGPAFLIGGRGTGKTTSLQNLSYQGQTRLRGDDPAAWESIGIYWRIGTNSAAAFRGARLTTEEWTRVFSHYVNLELCKRILSMVAWFDVHLGVTARFSSGALEKTSRSLGIATGGTLSEVREALEVAAADFEDSVNQLSSASHVPRTSTLGRPLDLLVDGLQEDPVFASKAMLICIDEYENLEDYQQRVINTLIKHVGDSHYTFKIGVKTTGIRDRRTLSDAESISEPADYKSIDIVSRFSDRGFDAFAERICLQRLASEGVSRPDGIRSVFPALTEENEARLLGVDRRLKGLRTKLIAEGATGSELEGFDGLEILGQYLIQFWSESNNTETVACLREALLDPEAWAQRRRNYSHAMLFSIRDRTGSFFKYYAGWSTLTRVAGGNIRYLLQLASEAMRLQQEEDDTELLSPVSAANQTRAVQTVGEGAVFDLQSMSPLGSQLTSFVLNLGQVFHAMAREPQGHAPEITQFKVTERHSDAPTRQLDNILREAVVHAALLVAPGDKMAKAAVESKAFNYALHPIFSGFMGYSSRSKRRMTLTVREALMLTLPDGRQAVRSILARSNRYPLGSDQGTLPGFDLFGGEEA
jgi:hypothetical protein